MADTSLMNFLDLAKGVGGTLFGESVHTGFSSVSIDTRTLKPGALFIPLHGSTVEGHDYIEKAFQAGAVAALVETEELRKRGDVLQKASLEAGAVLVLVPNTLRALQDAALTYLKKFPSLLRIGITGSSGKTTTKELTAAMLRKEKRVVMNEGNLNSETGLPLSIFQIRNFHEVGVFELGMNRVGEIAELARVLRPHIALVSNISTAHIGILGTKDAIAKEKKEIFSCFTGSEVALIPEQDEYSAYLAEGVKGRVRAYGPTTLRSYDGSQDRGLEGTEILWAGKSALLKLPGQHNLMNALAAATIAEEVGVSSESIRKGIETVGPLFGRGEILRGDITILQDCYNANPASMEAAISFCDSVPWEGRRIYILGSMLELGAASSAEHRRIGSRLASSQADAVFLFGKETEDVKAGLEEAHGSCYIERCDDMETLIPRLKRYIRKGDLLLLKGSRGTTLERISQVLHPEKKGA